MIILHCMKQSSWDAVRNQPSFGEENIAAEGFIHCSPVSYFWRVAPNFADVADEMVLLCIDADWMGSFIRWEDGDQCGRAYPHVYSTIPTDAVVRVLPYLKDENGVWVKNEELASIPNM